MVLPAETVSVLALVAVGAVVVLGVAAVVLALRLRALRKAYASALDPSRREDLFQAVERQANDLQGMRDDLGVVHANTEMLRDLLRGTISRVGMIRYDAFEDMGGALSFSAALLDEDAHGVVISAINGRSETRCYAKAIKNGESEHNLSTEELAAIDAALNGNDKGEVAPPRSRGRRRAS